MKKRIPIFLQKAQEIQTSYHMQSISNLACSPPNDGPTNNEPKQRILSKVSSISNKHMQVANG